MENAVFRCKSIKKMSDEAIIAKLNEFRSEFDNKTPLADSIDIDLTASTEKGIKIIINDVAPYGINNSTALLYQGIRFVVDKLNRGEEVSKLFRYDWAIPGPMADNTAEYEITFYMGKKTLNLLSAIGSAFVDPKVTRNNNHSVVLLAAIHIIFTCVFDNSNQFIEYTKTNPLFDIKVQLNTYQTLRFNKMMKSYEFNNADAVAFNTVLHTSYFLQDQLPSIEDFKKAMEYAKSYTTVSEVLKAWRKKHKQLLSCYIGEDEKQYLEYMLLSNTVNYEKLNEFLYSGKKGE